MNYIERPEYMQRLLDLMGTPDIKIITGVRRSGKSELMKAYIRRIGEIQPDANIIYVDFFDLKYEGLKEYHALYDYIESHYTAGKQNYVFVDEVQLCDKFENGQLYVTEDAPALVQGVLLTSGMAKTG